MAESSANTAVAEPKKLSTVKIAVIISVVVMAQCLLAYLYMSSGAKAEVPAEHSAKSEHGEHAGHGEHADQREVDLGEFSLTASNPAANTTLLIDFHLYGTVDEEQHAAGEADAGHGGGHGGGHGDKGEAVDDQSAFGKLFKKNKHRFRDQVIVIIRNAEMADLADPGLGLIKRQILAKTNALLGEPLLKEVIFSDFAVVEQ